jgi:hypothetical protein
MRSQFFKKYMNKSQISGDGINGLEFSEPKKISETVNGLPILSLEKLIEYKISSGIYGDRLKDLGDVQELIKANKLPLDFGDNFRKDLREKYSEIWYAEQKREKKERDWER